MNPYATAQSHIRPHDEDMAEQAVPGHGIPSQDPDPKAQVPLEPGEAEREANSVLTGGGLVGGAVVGASIGVAVGGPVGVLVGGMVGAVAGTLGGIAAGTAMNTAEPDSADPLPEGDTPAPITTPAKTAGAKP